MYTILLWRQLKYILNHPDRFLALITKVEDSIRTDNSINFSQFERELQKIAPSKKSSSEAAKSIMSAINTRTEVYVDYFKKLGLTRLVFTQKAVKFKREKNTIRL